MVLAMKGIEGKRLTYAHARTHFPFIPGSRGRAYDISMPRTLATAVLLLGLAASPLAAMEQHVCLTRAEQQAAVSAGQAITLAAAIKAARAHSRARQVVRAQLCREAKGLVYVLTVLARDGRVTHARVEAASGGLIDEL
jgi:hypothetical protein